MNDTPLERIVLLVRCADRPGIVAEVAELIARSGGNIVHADQHTDRARGLFLQRVEVELGGADAPGRDALAAAFEPVARSFEMSWSIHDASRRARLGLLVSREGHCLTDLLSRIDLGELDAEVAVVASNHDVLRPTAERFGVAFQHLPITAPDDRDAQERRVEEALRQAEVELVVLARYMQILSDGLCQRWRHRIINIHHSFLPAFKGARPYHRAHDRGVKIIGATAHYATADLDEGPIIVQDVEPISHRDEIPDLVRKGRDLERVVLARAVRLHLEHRVLAYDNRTVVFD